jgi:hypothetical protein
MPCVSFAVAESDGFLSKIMVLLAVWLQMKTQWMTSMSNSLAGNVQLYKEFNNVEPFFFAPPSL